MRRIATALGVCLLAAGAMTSTCAAQPPDEESGLLRRNDRQSAPSVERIVARMMAFDKNKDGKLTRDEITDPRLLRLFDRADANHDGVVTKEELTALAKKMVAEAGQGGFGPDRFGPMAGGFGPPGGFGPGGPPQPGQVLSPRAADMLKLTEEQKRKLVALQKEVDAKLAKILTSEQATRLKNFQRRRGDGSPPPPDDARDSEAQRVGPPNQ